MKGALLLVALASSAPAQVLPSWNDGPTRSEIVAFVTRVTTEGTKDFVRARDRIAVFDNDGTLWAEQPMYFQFQFALDRAIRMSIAALAWPCPKGQYPCRRPRHAPRAPGGSTSSGSPALAG